MANIDIRTAGKEVQTSKGQMILGVNANDLVVINPEKLVETTNAFSNIKSDLANSKKAIAELNDKKITKFYASNLGETNLSDSDKGKLADMFIYGRSVQDGTPTPDTPVDIQSVVNPKLRIVGGTKGALLSEFQYNTLTTTLKSYLDNRLEIYYIPKNNHGFNYAVIIILNDENFRSIDQFGSVENYASEYWIITLRNVGILLCSSTVDPKETIGYGIEPQTATLSYTLNAIPVSDGGNVTIDGQQYIADYVDIENKKLVRLLAETNGDGLKISDSMYFKKTITNGKDGSIALCNKFKDSGIGNYATEMACIVSNLLMLRSDSWNPNKNKTLDDVGTSDLKVIYQLATPTITDLTDEEVQAFKDLATYYPTTNAMVTSDQLDGYTTFNYPISMENGWNLIKEQLGDTREYIYDMELQSAEAYVNSEYAVALAELEV